MFMAAVGEGLGVGVDKNSMKKTRKEFMAILQDDTFMDAVLELKKQARGEPADTEVILAAYKEYGQSCVKYFDGMFAFAIWDNTKKLLFGARDRFGEKSYGARARFDMAMGDKPAVKFIL